MVPPVTVLTVAFGENEKVIEWASRWHSAGAQCLVCDNGGCLRDSFPWLTILPYQGNSGFGGGINRAVEAADTPLVLITNPDTLPIEGSSLELFAGRHQKKTLSSGSTVNMKGMVVHSTGAWPELTWVRRQVFKPAESLWNPERIDWLQGSLILANREEFLQLGGFGSTFPLYFEDVDLCARAQRAGMRVDFEPDIWFMHDEGTGSSRSISVRLKSFHWGIVEFFRNHKPVEYNQVRKLILLKCLLRSSVLAPFQPAAASGYMAGFRSILRRIPPSLPGSPNG